MAIIDEIANEHKRQTLNYFKIAPDLQRFRDDAQLLLAKWVAYETKNKNMSIEQWSKETINQSGSKSIKEYQIALIQSIYNQQKQAIQNQIEYADLVTQSYRLIDNVGKLFNKGKEITYSITLTTKQKVL